MWSCTTITSRCSITLGKKPLLEVVNDLDDSTRELVRQTLASVYAHEESMHLDRPQQHEIVGVRCPCCRQPRADGFRTIHQKSAKRNGNRSTESKVSRQAEKNVHFEDFVSLKMSREGICNMWSSHLYDNPGQTVSENTGAGSKIKRIHEDHITGKG